MLRRHLRYLSYIARHKWFVFRAGLKTGAPLLALIIHDWSKLTPAEWGPYARYFDPTVRRNDWVRFSFDKAWLHHQHHNPHHWQHWILREDNGKVKTLPMPRRYMLEMVADWMGAGRAITGRWEVAEWYAKNRDTIQLAPSTRQAVEDLIEEVG